MGHYHKPPGQFSSDDRPFTTCLGNTVTGVDDALLSRLEELLDLKANAEYLEVEAKLGLFQFNGRPPVHALSESILTPGMCKNFASQISKHAYLRIQKVLDDDCDDSTDSFPDGAGVKRMKVRNRTTVTTLDEFYRQAHSGNTVRVTTDSQTKKLVCIVQKDRLADINVFSATQQDAFDFRISLNNEVPATMPQGRPKYFRRKRRTTYKFDGWSIDMTEVFAHRKPEPHFEVEIEISTEVLWSKRETHERRRFLKDFLHSVRVLSRAAVDYTHESFLPAMQTLPQSEETRIRSVKRRRSIPQVCNEKYTSEVGDVFPMVGHFLQRSAEENALKKRAVENEDEYSDI